MNKNDNPNPGWEPEFTLDLALASGQAFQEIVEQFGESTKALAELPRLPFEQNGWYTITPEIAEVCLRRNRPGANRKASLATVVYYAAQMKANMWPKTGQPIIFTVDGINVDGQHREWAAYLGLVPFETYVIIDAPVTEYLFAYIDNGKARNPSAALQTAGLNGLSSLISQIVQVANYVDADAYTCHKKKHIVRMAPIEVLRYVEKRTEIRKAARLTAGEYKEAYGIIGHKDITGYVAYKIIELHNEEVCDRFMEELAFPNDARSDSDPLRALHVYLAKQAKSDAPEAKHLVLAHVIKAFNAWVTGTPLKRVSLHTDDPFPQFVETESAQPEETE